MGCLLLARNGNPHSTQERHAFGLCMLSLYIGDKVNVKALQVGVRVDIGFHLREQAHGIPFETKRDDAG